MVLKCIRCTVPETQQKAFSNTQQAWQGLQGVPGFILQVGGWDTQNAREAVVFSVWSGREAYEQFMEVHHDPIFKKSKQGRTYSGIRVALFQANCTAEQVNAVLLHPEVWIGQGQLNEPPQRASLPKGLPEFLLALSTPKSTDFCIISPAKQHTSNPQPPAHSFLQNAIKHPQMQLICTVPEWQVRASLSNRKK